MESSKRERIEEALRLQRILWVNGHPEFRSPDSRLLGDEVLTHSHIKAYAGLIGKKVASWNALSLPEIELYIFALKVEAACWMLDLAEVGKRLEIV
jgi:hypothetical protein